MPESRSPRCARLLALGLGALLASQAPAQRRIEGEVIQEGLPTVHIAVAGSPGVEGESAKLAGEVLAAVRDDLEFTGLFDVVDPALYRLVPPGEPGKVRHDDWLSIGAESLARIEVTARDGRIDAQMRLYDNPSRARLAAQRYGGSLELSRRVAHQIANDVIQHFTGRPGVAMSRIAFVSGHGAGKELYLMDYDGQRVRRLTTTGTLNLSPVWSPRGDRLAFVSWRGRQPGVYIMDADGTLNRAPAVDGELNAAPDWSPDGTQIVYGSDVDGNSEIYLLDLTRNRNTRLTRTPGIETAPDFSPNGREIAFTSDRSGNPQVYVMDVHGLNVRRLSRSGSYNESPAWSPQGDRLAYVSRIDGRFEVVVLDLAGGTLSRLTHGEGNNENPAWSPDGRHLVFSSDRAGRYDLYTMRADGSDVRRLTRGGDCFTADWSR